jgi:hypothetical protein
MRAEHRLSDAIDAFGEKFRRPCVSRRSEE